MSMESSSINDKFFDVSPEETEDTSESENTSEASSETPEETNEDTVEQEASAEETSTEQPETPAPESPLEARLAEVMQKLTFLEGKLSAPAPTIPSNQSTAEPQEDPEALDDATEWFIDPKKMAENVARQLFEEKQKEQAAFIKQEQDFLARVEASVPRAKAKYSDFDKAERMCAAAAKKFPALAAEVKAAPDPAEYVYQWYSDIVKASEAPPSTEGDKAVPQMSQEELVQEAMRRIRAEDQGKLIDEAKQQPRPLGGERNAPPLGDPPLAEDDILDAATAHNKY